MKEKVILLVEDNPQDEAFVLRALKKKNIINEVVVARDGAEALDYLFATGAYASRNPADLPTFVMLDLKLPKIDGLEVLKRIRANEKTKHLPVAIFTSSNEQKDIMEGYRLGVNSYVCKPVDFVAFAETVGQLGLYWLLQNEPLPPTET